MTPNEVHDRILEDHADLRERTDTLDSLSESFEKGGAEAGQELRDQAAALYEVFAAHLGLEDQHLVPALRAIPKVGDALGDRLAREHGEQRLLILYLLSRLEEQDLPTLVVAREIKSFAQYLREDMKHEEATLLREHLLGC